MKRWNVRPQSVRLSVRQQQWHLAERRHAAASVTLTDLRG